MTSIDRQDAETVPAAGPAMVAAPAARTRRRRGSSLGAVFARGGLVQGAVLAALVLFLLVVVVFPAWITPGDPTASVGGALLGPSPTHLFGTDSLGRDVLTRTVWGANPILFASVTGILISTVIGVSLGLLGGMTNGFVSGLVMRILDVMLALPALLIALMVVAIVGTGVTSIVIAVGVAYIPAFARVVYSSVKRLRTADYIAAARLFGSSRPRTVARHLLPNLATEIAVVASSAVGWAVLTATTLSFLGFGVSLPAPDWGVDLSAGGQFLETAWWISTFPGLAITATILLSNYLGDYVSSILDPRHTIRVRQPWLPA
ncbi:ABC transporter permease [Pseudonocardia aurantiaca]|uniref:ABC transporter permease n=1 Tax=Pseudonocardia aurantiaca TaxID=75290 RepID=A0ABW4FPW9_9PSEU